jgi:topoisomerase-4 subunit A
MSAKKNHIPQHIETFYEEWFTHYASYVALARAIPAIEDGFKPSQRRIMHAMKVMEDGRYNKVANIIGQTMQYHPHGDASITDALVQLGQKDMLIDKQGNWGDVRTGDGAAAARYIEARLTPFSLEVLYSSEVTLWKPSYDGRKQEPVTLPVKFPLLLAQGAEGIAVGLATKILPHNFGELIRAAIQLLQGKEIVLYPDFPAGGVADCSSYNQGKRGGKVYVRATCQALAGNKIAITSLPHGVTTSSLIESILQAHQKRKISFKQIEDNTAEKVDIIIHLLPKSDPNTFIQALYHFTDCQVTLSPNACVIKDNKPAFLPVEDILAHSVAHTRTLLQRELLVAVAAYKEKCFTLQLERIFITKKIYPKLAECTSMPAILAMLAEAIAPYQEGLYRTIQRKDLIHLTEIKIRRISSYDGSKRKQEEEKYTKLLRQAEQHLAQLTKYAIAYYRNLLKKYGDAYPRKTKLEIFAPISGQKVALAAHKVYFDRKTGFIGYEIGEATFIDFCSSLDKILTIQKDGSLIMVPAAAKRYIGSHILHATRFDPEAKIVYNLVYLDGVQGIVRGKRFYLKGLRQNKHYSLVPSHSDSRILHLSVGSEEDAPRLQLLLSPLARSRKSSIEVDLANLRIMGQYAQGNIITKHAVKKVSVLKS